MDVQIRGGDVRCVTSVHVITVIYHNIPLFVGASETNSTSSNQKKVVNFGKFWCLLVPFYQK